MRKHRNDAIGLAILAIVFAFITIYFAILVNTGGAYLWTF